MPVTEAEQVHQDSPRFALPHLSGRQRVAVFAALVAVVAAAVYILNWLTPLVSDDFGIVASMRGVTSAGRFVQVVGASYMGWDGRLIGAATLRLFAMFDKNVFGVANTLAFLLLTALMYLHVRGRGRLRPMLYGFVVVCLWFLVPAFGQVFLWMTGSTVYLWPLLFILAFMLPYRLHVERPGRGSVALAVLVFVLGVAAGWSSTNVSAGVIVWVALLIRYCPKRDVPVRGWMWSGLAGAVAGFVALVAAPGNYVRDAAAAGTGLLERVFRYLFWLANERALALALVFLAILVVGLVTTRLRRGDLELDLSLIYVAAAALSAGVMIAAPDYPLRAFSGSAVLVIVAAGLLLTRLDLSDRRLAVPLAAIGAVLVVGLVASLAGAAYDIKTTKDQTAARALYVAQQKAAGNLDVTVTVIVPKTEYNPLYKLYDVTGSPDFWANTHLADYYGVRSITGRLNDD
jgi:hypothetical protein